MYVFLVYQTAIVHAIPRNGKPTIFLKINSMDYVWLAQRIFLPIKAITCMIVPIPRSQAILASASPLIVSDLIGHTQ
jgi:hypothetical protein